MFRVYYTNQMYSNNNNNNNIYVHIYVCMCVYIYIINTVHLGREMKLVH